MPSLEIQLKIITASIRDWSIAFPTVYRSDWCRLSYKYLHDNKDVTNNFGCITN